MPNCKYCNTPLPENETGRRPREFCDNKQKCRNLWHRKNKKEKSITIPIDQWKDIQAKLLENNKPENKEKIEEERKGVKNDVSKSVRQNPITQKEATTEPKENTMAFYLKYDCYTLKEVEEKQKVK